ncbi:MULTISPECIES: ArsR/SmtB family transcription factor [Halolamina]|uniref:DNA-binding transcriptional regulator, ArsR family n=1 Tax=Halolamina pelagica TaxID=699431 RepID=A0A1I5Q8I7_9EURY|nr:MULTISPECIES: helix-turn-helix domain-containing protein [Halolamina]NHX35151.1 helix-turn-helix transcriptional regulator [Halolamina sp. R1-12]SFP42648.1 DNA-binding transcriptional regulator, ArsR family [Halolamina pelagica]
MSSRDVESDESYPVDRLLDALSDETSRRILSTLTEPTAAAELADDCDIPSSTVYRKLDVLTRAELIEERVILKPGYGRCSVYERNIERVAIAVEDGGFSVAVDRPSDECDGGQVAMDD